MVARIAFAALACLLLPMAIAKALHLTDVSFEHTIQKEIPIFVLFFMPWCGHCKEMLPVWDALSSDLKGEAIIAAVDLEKNKLVEHRFRHKVGGYPTMLLLYDGKSYAYTGTRDLVHLKQFVREDFRAVKPAAIADIPPDPESMSLWEKVVETLSDFFIGVMRGYSGIWEYHREAFLAAITTSFSLGGFFGFFVKVFIDWMIPPAPPRAAMRKKTN